MKQTGEIHQGKVYSTHQSHFTLFRRHSRCLHPGTLLLGLRLVACAIQKSQSCIVSSYDLYNNSFGLPTCRTCQNCLLLSVLFLPSKKFCPLCSWHYISHRTIISSRQQKHKQTKWNTLWPLWKHIGIRTKGTRRLSWNLTEETAASPKSTALKGRWNKKIYRPVRYWYSKGKS